jgi:predicted TIM-barrel fold metal-dependent hydrolase
VARTYKVISADSHLELSPERWTGRVPAKYRDLAPRLIKLPHGGDGIMIEGQPVYVLGAAITGKPYEEHQLYGINYEGSPGAGSPQDRLKEQDIDGVDAEVMYTSAGNSGFWRGIRDDQAYCAVVHAYNEFLAEEYCAAAPDRLLAMGVIPMASIDASVKELEYCARAGLKGIMLGTFPNGKGYPTAEDDRFWAAALDTEMPLTAHVGFVAGRGPTFKYEREPAGIAGRGDPVWQVARPNASAGAQVAVQLIFARVFDRFPRLQFYFAESNIGWVPFFLEQADDRYRRLRFIAEREYGVAPLKRLPSEYVKDHCHWGFIRDTLGVQLRHLVGVEKVMWENDFPHNAGDWPHSREVIDEMFAGVPDDEKHQMLAGNAVKYFHLEDSRN